MILLKNIALLCGVIYFLAAVVQRVYPPRDINSLYGYRTPRSMRSLSHWAFAQRYSVKKLFESAAFLVVVGVIVGLSGWQQDTQTIVGLTALVGVSIYLIWRTEKALKQKFPS